MWQVLLIVYFVVTLLCALLLWSALVVAKKTRADQDTKTEKRPNMDLVIGSCNELREEQAVQLPPVSELQ